MKKSFQLVATLALAAGFLTATAQTTPPATGTAPMQDGSMQSTTMKHGKMHKNKMKKDKMKDDMGKSKMSDDKMKTKM